MNEVEFIKDLIEVLKKHNVTIVPSPNEDSDFGSFLFDDDDEGNHERAVLFIHTSIDGNLMG